jgi:hypothetical protein
LLTALVAAGCVAPVSTVSPESLGTFSPAGLLAYAANATVAIPPAFSNLSAAVFSVGQTGSEPTIGITSDGSIYVTGGGAQVYKSTDHGRTFTDVTPAVPRRADADPYLWVDPATNRIFSAPLYVACSYLEWSDNGGSSWSEDPIAGCGLPGHDHQSLVTGPPPQGVRTSGYPDVVYYTYNSFREDGTWVVTSMDGGQTWSVPGSKVAPDDPCETGLDGAPAVAPDGTVIVPKPTCSGMYIAASHDAGATWKGVNVNDAGTDGAKGPTGQGLVGPSVAYAPNPGARFDSAGNGYVAFAGADGRMYLTRSTDDAASWLSPILVSPPMVNATAFSTLASGGPGRIAMAYLGTTNSTASWKGHAAQWATNDTDWNLYITMSDDALATHPTFTTLRVNPAEAPIQRGCIWQSGGKNDCRNLGDFFGIAQSGGRAAVVFVQGCEACTSAATSHRGDLKVAIVETGASLVDGAPLLRLS